MDNILITEKSEGYELLDSGDGKKLERFGEVTISRSDPQALWPKSLPNEVWDKANAKHIREEKLAKWEITSSIEEPWEATINNLTFSLELLPSKHVGLFPEQSPQWKWLEEKIKHDTNTRMSTNDTNKDIKVLNLFGYTGGATLACAKAGASVCHVDASKFAVDLAHKNLDLSGLGNKPVRFIVDDVRKFVEREIKRGNRYDVILLDPPVYGKGLKGEVWKIENDLMPLLLRIKEILSGAPLAIVLNGYASGYSHTTYCQMLEVATSGLEGKVSSGELAIKESASGKLLTSGIYARFEN